MTKTKAGGTPLNTDTPSINRSAPSASGRRVNRKTEGVQESIIDAAAKVFAKKGYQLTKLGDISSALGMHVTALRYHFPTKDVIAEELINRLIRLMLTRVTEAIDALPESASFRAKIEAATVAYLTASLNRLDHVAAHGNVINQLPPAVRDGHFLLLSEFNAVWRHLMDEAAARGELRPGINHSVATQVLLGTLIWTQEWYRPGRLSPDALALEILNILFEGIAPSAE
jgi:AcrR family transcriptional regulator